MAALIRETLEENLSTRRHRIGDNRAAYTAAVAEPGEVEEMKRIVVSLPDDLHNRVRMQGHSRGVSMAAYVRETLEERTRRERPKPTFGAFESGFTDTAEMAGEFQYEPRSWH